MRTLNVIGTLCLLSAPLIAQTAPSSARWTDFTKQFQAYVDSDKVVGATALLVRDGRVIGRYDTGFQDQSANVRVDSQTIYHWGSITKALTAISIMQLRDRGKLSLDDRIVRWVPASRSGCCCRTPRVSRTPPGRTATTSRGSRSSPRRGTSSSR